MSRWKRTKGKIKNSYKAYKHGFVNFRKLIKFMKIAPSGVDEKSVPHMTVFEVKDLLDKNDLLIVDVRSLKDYTGVHIEGSVQMDLFSLLEHLDELPKDKNIGMLCYGGGASLTATQMLIERGFTNVKNITGGIIRYALDIDDSLLGNL